MYGLTRATFTLVGAAVAGLLLWLGTRMLPTNDLASTSAGDYWPAFGLVAAAGLTMALSQLLGGWTKWGWPRVSLNVFLLGFLPTLIAGGWILAAGEPGDHWLGTHVRNWSDDIGIDRLVGDLTIMVPAIAFGIGLVFGFTFDTTGPRLKPGATPAPAGATEQRKPVEDGQQDDRRIHIREGGTPAAPEAEEAPPKE